MFHLVYHVVSALVAQKDSDDPVVSVVAEKNLRLVPGRGTRQPGAYLTSERERCAAHKLGMDCVSMPPAGQYAQQ